MPRLAKRMFTAVLFMTEIIGNNLNEEILITYIRACYNDPWIHRVLWWCLRCHSSFCVAMKEHLKLGNF